MIKFLKNTDLNDLLNDYNNISGNKEIVTLFFDTVNLFYVLIYKISENETK